MRHKTPKQDLLKQADLVVYSDEDETTIGIIVSVNNNADWWGGGYYHISWNQQALGLDGQSEVSYEEMHRWRLSNKAKVFPVPNNEWSWEEKIG